ncbi:hypothetical protein QCA50_019576 [Cerrena zonata]|uniref:Pseudouridine synthase RsuA/RluA-like domain-containing protein n=1 Tax=Cerrena zonata TaxID=2478898 RepID=A0AAW0FIM4_9APHY
MLPDSYIVRLLSQPVHLTGYLPKEVLHIDESAILDYHLRSVLHTSPRSSPNDDLTRISPAESEHVNAWFDYQLGLLVLDKPSLFHPGGMSIQRCKPAAMLSLV